jgi:hypothetical protein
MSTSISDLLYWCALDDSADDERSDIQTAENKHILKVFVNGKEIEDPNDQALSKGKFFDRILQRGFLDYPAIWLPTQHHCCIPLTHPPMGKRYIAFWALTPDQLEVITQLAKLMCPKDLTNLMSHIQEKVALGTINSGITSTEQIPRLTLICLFDSEVFKAKSSEHIKKLNSQKLQTQNTIKKQLANRKIYKKEIEMGICFACMDTAFSLLPSVRKVRFDHLISVKKATLSCVASTGRYNRMYLDCRTFDLPESDQHILHNRVMSTILKDMANEIHQSALITCPNEINLLRRDGAQSSLGELVNTVKCAFQEVPELLFQKPTETQFLRPHYFQVGPLKVSTLNSISLFILKTQHHKNLIETNTVT